VPEIHALQDDLEDLPGIESRFPVRQAMNYAIDKEAITQGLFSGMAPISRAPVSVGSLVIIRIYPSTNMILLGGGSRKI
jgi:hypothetical protein